MNDQPAEPAASVCTPEKPKPNFWTVLLYGQDSVPRVELFSDWEEAGRFVSRERPYSPSVELKPHTIPLGPIPAQSIDLEAAARELATLIRREAFGRCPFDKALADASKILRTHLHPPEPAKPEQYVSANEIMEDIFGYPPEPAEEKLYVCTHCGWAGTRPDSFRCGTRTSPKCPQCDYFVGPPHEHPPINSSQTDSSLTDEQPEALRLANILQVHIISGGADNFDFGKAAAELRRLHSANEEQDGEIGCLRIDQGNTQDRIISLHSQVERQKGWLRKLEAADARVATLEAEVERANREKMSAEVDAIERGERVAELEAEVERLKGDLKGAVDWRTIGHRTIAAQKARITHYESVEQAADVMEREIRKQLRHTVGIGPYKALLGVAAAYTKAKQGKGTTNESD